MALSAAFSMALIIIGVANTSGSIASLNVLARSARVTRCVNDPFAPSGIARIKTSRRDRLDLSHSPTGAVQGYRDAIPQEQLCGFSSPVHPLGPMLKIGPIAVLIAVALAIREDG